MRDPSRSALRKWVGATLRLKRSATDKRYRLAEYRAERKNGTTTGWCEIDSSAKGPGARAIR